MRNVAIRVFDGTDQHKPLEGALVSISDGSEILQKKATDVNGRADFSDMPNYRLTVEVVGNTRLNQTVKAVQIYEQEQHEHNPLNFYLHGEQTGYMSHLGGRAAEDTPRLQEAQEIQKKDSEEKKQKDSFDRQSSKPNQK